MLALYNQYYLFCELKWIVFPWLKHYRQWDAETPVCRESQPSWTMDWATDGCSYGHWNGSAGKNHLFTLHNFMFMLTHSSRHLFNFKFRGIMEFLHVLGFILQNLIIYKTSIMTIFSFFWFELYLFVLWSLKTCHHCKSCIYLKKLWQTRTENAPRKIFNVNEKLITLKA